MKKNQKTIFFFSTEEENYFRSNFPTLKKKTSKYSGNVPSLLSNSFNILDREKKQSFNSPSPKKKHINFSRTEEFFNLSTFGKDSKGEIFYEDDSSHIKYKKRRPTTKAILNFTFRNSSIYNYECLFFTKYENQIQPFKHDCVLCFSGNLIEYIYNRKNKINEENNPLEKYKLDILMTLLKDRAKIFYSMSPEQKSFLIKIYRKYLKKSVCFVGINASDIESMALSNIGIMIGPPLNFNTLFCHYYLCDKSLLSIEKILKNGRSYYENVSHLLSVNSIFTILSIIFIISTYKLNTFINSKLYIFINTSVFLLCLSAFSIETNYAVDINSLIMDNKLYLIYNIIKIIGTIFIKVAEYPILLSFYKNNEENSVKINNEILTFYLFLFTWAQITSIIFAFNTQSFFRKHLLNNIIFIFIFFFILEYLIMNLTLSDISFKQNNSFLFINLETNNDNLDTFEDHHKLLILFIFFVDIILTYLLIRFLRIFFEKYTNKKINKIN